jgi:ABC-2 type transport system ATP-binding protein
MNEIVIESKGLSKRFGENRALDGLDFAVRRGEVFGFLGPNGAGKTTTVRVLNGILAPSAGEVRVFGLDPLARGAEVRRRSGVLTETPALYESLPARENLAIFGALYGVPQEALPGQVARVLELLGLADRADEKAGAFSRGMKQRLAIARALLHEPELVFLDEPTAGLDPEAARHVTELIEVLSRAEGRTVFLCTHNLLEAQRLCSRVAVINKGRLLAVGSPAELGQSLWRGTWVEVELAAPAAPALSEALRSLPGVQEVQQEGMLLTVRLANLQMTPDVVERVVGSGARVMRVVPREHTLEDIYFELQEGADQEAPRPATQDGTKGGSAR